MIKPEHLKPGDKVAIVSLSNGTLGEPWAIHKLDIAKKRLEEDFKLKVVVMPNALKGISYLRAHPEARAKDLMDAFKDKSIKAIFNAIGGDDTIRLLPYIDFDLIKNNPKIFTGFSDTTVNHFMMHKAGLISYYGANIMNNFSEYVKINDYTKQAIIDTLFSPKDRLEISPCPVASYNTDIVWWKEENMNTARKFHKDTHGYEVLQGHGKVRGRLIGGCVDTFIYTMGTPIWPKANQFKNAILCLEICDDTGLKGVLEYILRNLNAQGIFDQISGVIIGKPVLKEIYEPVKEVFVDFFKNEVKREFPVIYNVNFGHAEPIGVLPLGCMCEVDADNKTITLLEKATK